MTFKTDQVVQISQQQPLAPAEERKQGKGCRFRGKHQPSVFCAENYIKGRRIIPHNGSKHRLVETPQCTPQGKFNDT